MALAQVVGSTICFLAKEKGAVLESEGDCTTAWSPESSFKIALSLIGFDAGILKSESDPSWPLPEGTDPYINTCRGDHNPRTWMRDSCLWYSRILTSKLGMEKFQAHIDKLGYGNQDLSGGLTNAWIWSGRSLKISPEQQVDFLMRVGERRFPLSKASYHKTKAIMFLQEMPGGWKLYGKTGNGRHIDQVRAVIPLTCSTVDLSAILRKPIAESCLLAIVSTTNPIPFFRPSVSETRLGSNCGIPSTAWKVKTRNEDLGSEGLG